MRRALQAASPLLRHGTSAASACSEVCAASGPTLAAAVGGPGGGGGGGSGGGPIISPPWALSSQAPLHTSAAAQLAGRSGAGASGAAGCGSSGNGSADSCGASRGSSGSSRACPGKRGRPLSPVPNVDAKQLLRSLGLDGAADPAALLTNLRKLPGVRQQGVLDNAAAVVAHLRSPAVGLTAQQAGQLLCQCPYLFSWPPEQRAAVLFGELLGDGLTAAAVARCTIAYPHAANCTTPAPGLAELAAILAHSQDRDSSRGGRVRKVPAARRTVTALLTQTPSALVLVCQRAGYLRQRAAELQQAGFSAAAVAALAWERPEVLCSNVAKLAAAAAMLQQELGLPAAEVVSLAARLRPRWLTSSAETLRQRAVALAEDFGQPAAAAMLLKSTDALGCDTAVWRRNLCYMAACGVADPKAVLMWRPQLLSRDQAAPSFLQRRLLLQRSFGLTAAQLYERPHLFELVKPGELAQRLRFVEQHDQAHRLVAQAAPVRKPAGASAEEWQPALSTVAVTGKADRFLLAAGASQAEWEAWAAANPPDACPLYRWAQQAAAEEAAQLAAALPPQLAQAERGLHPRFGHKG